jgi:hypothetical protein
MKTKITKSSGVRYFLAVFILGTSLTNAPALAQNVSTGDTAERRQQTEKKKANAAKNLIQLLAEQGPNKNMPEPIVTENSARGIKHEAHRELELWKRSMPVLRTYRTLKEANEAPYVEQWAEEKLPSQDSGE